MDKEQARFILQSFRPDGADAQDADFAEALAVAAKDRELGDWLAAERAQDAAFAAALMDLEIPEDLRDNILQVLKGESSAEEFTDMDAAFMGALATVRVPEGLRDQIVAAMEIETRSTEPESTAKEAPQRAWNWLRSAAVAAAVVLGAFVAIEMTSNPGSGGSKDSALTKKQVENETIHLVANLQPGSLAIQGDHPPELITYLEAKGVPTPSMDALPPGLQGVPGVGCRVLQIGEKKASLICFDKEGLGTVHLVVVNREDLKEQQLPTLGKVSRKSCGHCPINKVSVASWGDDNRAFFLLSKTDPDSLIEEVF